LHCNLNITKFGINCIASTCSHVLYLLWC